MRRCAMFVTMVLLSLWLASVTPVAGTGQDLLLGDALRSDARLGGLKWTFVRIRYGSEANRLEQFRRIYWSDPWAIDTPAAEQNLFRRMARVTSIKVNDPIILELSLDGDLADQHMETIALGIRNVLCVALRLVRYTDQATAPAEDRRIGVLYLDSREKGTLLSSPTTAALETLANEAAVAIENAKLYRTALEKAKLEQEIQTAAEIQRALLPAHHRTGPFFDAAAKMLPCRSIGGDSFDYIDLPDGVLGFALGDVAGKGPPVALLGAMLLGSLAVQAYASAGPAATVTAVNTALVRRGIQGRFVTLFYAVLFLDGRLTYCNGDHNPPMLVSGTAGVQRLETGGMVIGLFDGVPFEEATVVLKPDDFLVTFTDSVSEALDPSGEEFGDDRLLASIAAMRATEVQPRLQHIFASVSEFTTGAAQHDDITAMIVGYRSPASRS